MDNLLNLQFESQQLNELATALSKAQSRIRAAVKDAENPHFRSSYADLASVWDACREALTTNGLAVTQCLMGVKEVCLVTTLLHASGQFVRSVYPVNPVKPDPQGYGSAITYARRYALAAIVGVAPDDDDDGNAAGGSRPQAKASQPRGPGPAPAAAKQAQPAAARAAAAPAPALKEETKCLPADSPGEFQITGGRFKGKRVKEISAPDLMSYVGELRQAKPTAAVVSLEIAIGKFLDQLAQAEANGGAA